ncbi:MAG: hypothetical protein AAF242_14490, partial [Bacteroidota bacterium]
MNLEGNSISWAYPSSQEISGFELQVLVTDKRQDLGKRWESISFVFAKKEGTKYQITPATLYNRDHPFRLKVLR